MKRDVLRVALNDGAKAIAAVKHKEDPFDEASRALRKALDALGVLELTQTVQPPDFEPGINFYAEVRRFEIMLIRYALRKTGGRQTLAASLLSMNVTTLNAKIKAYQISRNGSVTHDD
jgi:DNA-binding NtrC family response regulator